MERCINALGWLRGAMVLSKLSSPWRPTDLNNSRARAYRACIRRSRVVFCIFFCLVYFSVFFLPLSGSHVQVNLLCFRPINSVSRHRFNDFERIEQTDQVLIYVYSFKCCHHRTLIWRTRLFGFSMLNTELNDLRKLFGWLNLIFMLNKTSKMALNRSPEFQNSNPKPSATQLFGIL